MLEHEADATRTQGRELAVVQRFDGQPVDRHGAGAGAIERADDVEHGGFARAGRPDNGNQFAARDLEADIAQGKDAAGKGAADVFE